MEFFDTPYFPVEAVQCVALECCGFVQHDRGPFVGSVPFLFVDAYLCKQGKMIGGDARQFRTGDFDAGHFKPRADEDVVNPQGRKATGKGAFGAVVLGLGLNVSESMGEPAAHRR